MNYQDLLKITESMSINEYIQYYVDHAHELDMPAQDLRPRLDSVRQNVGYLQAQDHVYACSRCAMPAHAHFVEPTKTLMLSKGLCFYCNHDDELLQKYKNGAKYFVIKGNLYTDAGRTNGNKQYNGHGGREFKIKILTDMHCFLAGDVLSTNNLWHGGHISEFIRGEMPDNAEFIHLKEMY